MTDEPQQNSETTHGPPIGKLWGMRSWLGTIVSGVTLVAIGAFTRDFWLILGGAFLVFLGIIRRPGTSSKLID